MGWLVPRSPRRVVAGWSCGALGAALLLLAGGAGARLHAQQADTVVFVNVNVVLADRYEILPDQMVVVHAGRIAEIRPTGSGAAPAGARRVEAQGRYLAPGLIELNGRIPHPKDVYGREDALLAYLARGVTGVRGHRTHSSQTELQSRIEAGKMLGPRLFLTEAPNGTPADPEGGPRGPDDWVGDWAARPMGMTAYEFLYTLTAGAAAALGDTTGSGTIEVGREANLVLLEANPFEGVAAAFARPAGVMVRGRWLSRAELEEAIEARARDLVHDHYGALDGGAPTRTSCTGTTLQDCFGGDADCQACNTRAMAKQRPILLERLDLLAALYPESDWIAGQRVNFALQQDDYDRAWAAAEACAGTEWWCQALRGYVLHTRTPGAGEVQFDSALAAAPPNAPAWGTPVHPPAGDRGLHCEWSDLSALLPASLREEYGRAGCTENESFNERFWWLTDPLWSRPGNERRAEHLARNVAMRLHDEILRLRNSFHPQSHHQDVMPFGLPNSWRLLGTAGSTIPARIELYVNGGYSFTPDADRFRDPVNSTAEDWALKWNHGHERMITREKWYNLDHQTVVLRRGRRLSVLAAAQLPGELAVRDSLAAYLAMGRPADLHVELAEARVGANGVVRASLELDSAEWVASIEAVGEGFRARARHGAPPPVLENGFGVSDVVLFDDRYDLGDVTLVDAMLPSASLTGRLSVGVYFEVYGVREDEPLRITIAGERIGGSFFRRITRAVLRRKPERPLRLKWTEGARGSVAGAMQRSLTIDLSDLPNGDYRLALTIERGEGEAVTSSRVIRVKKP